MRTTRKGKAPEQGTRIGRGEGRTASPPSPPAKTGADLAVEAVMAYAHLTATIKEASKAIGQALERCPRMPNGPFWQDRITHLSNYYAAVKTGEGVYQADAEVSACDCCRQARELVRDRKTLRQRLGAAKRRIGHAAKTLHAEHNLPDPEEQARALFLERQGDLFPQPEASA